MPKIIHNMSHTRLYQVWNAMKMRCANPNAISYKYYGGKGITVCDEWQTFEVFRDWALSNGYREGLSIDRIDSNGNYEPSNCRWATSKEQQNNTSYNRVLTYGDETHNITQWSEILGIPRTTLYNRARRGWSVSRLLSKPKQKYQLKKEI